MNGKKILMYVMATLMVVGSLNWGLVAICEECDLVKMIFGSVPMLQRAVYCLVGIAGLGGLVMFVQSCCKKGAK